MPRKTAPKTGGEGPRQTFNMAFSTYCALTAVKAELSAKAGRMITLSETIEVLIEEHKENAG